MRPTCPFLAFASVRGGTGRTTGAVACARYLHQQGLRPLVIDLDLECPGLTLELSPVGSGLSEIAMRQGSPKPTMQLVEKAAVHLSDLGISVLPAGQLDNGDASLYCLIDWLPKPDGVIWTLRLKQEIVNSGLFDVVLLDLRAGYSRIAQHAIVNLADDLFVLSHQQEAHLHDSARYVESAQGWRLQAGIRPAKVVVVRYMVPPTVSQNLSPPRVAYNPVIGCADALDRGGLRGEIDKTYRELATTVWGSLSS